MAVFCHLVGASNAGKRLDFATFEAFVLELLRERLVALPAAIFVGEACQNPDSYYWSVDAAYDYILPDSPGSMVELLEEYDDISSVKTLCYDGDDETTFREALRRAPFGEKDICVCFDLPIEGASSRCGEGVVIYALVRPFALHYEAKKSSFQRTLEQFVVFFTSVGRDLLYVKPVLMQVLERYFGAEPLLEEAMDW
jgi:hypothetical protein